MLFTVLVSCAVLAAPWPGETAAQAIDLTSLVPGTAAGFGQQVSDLHWNPVTRTLWVSRAPGGVWALVQGPDGGFRVAANYPAINSDYEGITQADFNEPAVFMLDESGGAIRKYSVDGAGTAVLLRTWSLAGVVPPLNGNAGPEGLTFIPDDSLRDAGFPTSAFDGGGLFLVAHQNGGQLYAVDLDPANSAGRTLIATLPTGRGESSGLAFDRSSGRLYVSHNTGTNFLEVDTLLKAANGGLLLSRLVELDSPSTSNLYLEKGKLSVDELIGDIKSGLFITDLIGFGINGVTGDYSRGAAGFLIENGEIVGPVSEITIASNLIEMFATLEPGSDLTLRKGIDSPTILVPEMMVGAA